MKKPTKIKRCVLHEQFEGKLHAETVCPKSHAMPSSLPPYYNIYHRISISFGVGVKGTPLVA